MEGWGSVKQAAEYAGTNPGGIRAWMKNGLKYALIGVRTKRIKYSHIDEYLEAHAVNSRSEAEMIQGIADDVINELKAAQKRNKPKKTNKTREIESAA